MQCVGNATSPSPDIILVAAQGRDPDAVHQDVQNARAAANDARQSAYADNSGSFAGAHYDLKEKMMGMLQAARADRDMNPAGPSGPNPDPDAPCPIP